MRVEYVQTREGYWSYSDFPHPLITLDYDDDGFLIGVEAVVIEPVHNPHQLQLDL